jgi:membrane protein YdbS with pleckstrin-like domain
MGMSAKLLGADERVVLRTRTHGKALFWPATALVVEGALLGVGTALVPSDYRPGGQYAVVLGVLALALWTSVVPYLRWRNRTYTLTNHRLITRAGVLSKTGKDLPLMRINDVSYQRSLTDRMLGCGSLYVQTAAEGALVLDDVPDVSRVHLVMTELLFGGRPPQLERSGDPWESPGHGQRAQYETQQYETQQYETRPSSWPTPDDWSAEPDPADAPGLSRRRRRQLARGR